MRVIEKTGPFKRDYKRESKGQYRLVLDVSLLAILRLLIDDKPLPPKYRDHPLSGEGSDHRDCHILETGNDSYRFKHHKSRTRKGH